MCDTYQHNYKQAIIISNGVETFGKQKNLQLKDFDILYSLTFLYLGREHLSNGKEKLESFVSLLYHVDGI